MILECLNCSFSKVVLVIVGSTELVLEPFAVDASDEFAGDLIVKALYLWADACIVELVVAEVVALDNLVSVASPDWCGEDGV